MTSKERYRTLGCLLNDLEQTNHLAIIFDGFYRKESFHSYTYAQLRDEIEKVF